MEHFFHEYHPDSVPPLEEDLLVYSPELIYREAHSMDWMLSVRTDCTATGNIDNNHSVVSICVDDGGGRKNMDETIEWYGEFQDR